MEEKQANKLRVIPLILPVSNSDFGSGLLGNIIAQGRAENSQSDPPFRILFLGGTTDRGLQIFNAGITLRPSSVWEFQFRLGSLRNPVAPYFGRSNFQDLQQHDRIIEGTEPTPDNIPASPDLIPFRDVTLNREYLDDVTRGEGLFVRPEHMNEGVARREQEQNRFYRYESRRELLTLSGRGMIGDTFWSLGLGFFGSRNEVDSYRGDREGGDFFPNGPTLLDLGLIVFFDQGRVGESWQDIDGTGWHQAGGVGLNFILGDGIVFELAGGRSRFEQFFSFQFGHSFEIRLN